LQLRAYRHQPILLYFYQMRHCIILFSFLFFIPSLKAQVNLDQMLAQEFYLNGEYEKAVVLYEKLFAKNPASKEIYRNYLNTVLELEDYKKGEKIVKKVIKQNPGSLIYMVDLGRVYFIAGNTSKATNQYDKTINQIPKDRIKISTLANAFLVIEEYEYALKTYLKGQRLYGIPGMFSFEVASIYEKKGDYKNMIVVYLGVLESDPKMLQSVKNNLQRSLTKKAQFNELQSQLYRKIQKHPDAIIFSELLIWQLIQNKDFKAAFIQVKALDRRLKGNGIRILKLARMAFKETAYDAAIEAYEYIIARNPNDHYNLSARIELLDCKKAKIVSTNTYTKDDLLLLKKDYKHLLTNYGKNASTAQIIDGLANLEALYLHNIDSAILLLEGLHKIRGISKVLVGNSKLTLGDYYLMTGDYWESTLLYSQVSKSFKDGPIGELARFKNAKLSYLKGDFEWAQAQLQVLQAATSELISNDAIDLYVFIQDHLALDTILVPMLMYAEADMLIFQNSLEKAFVMLDSIKKLFPGHTLSDDVLNAQAEIRIQTRDYIGAAKLLDEIISNYPYEILADDAIFKLACIYEEKLNDTEKAMKLYQQLIVGYSGSIWIVEARKRFRKIRGDQIN